MHRDPEIQEACSFPLALILWSYVVIYCSQCVHFLNFLSAVREGTNRKAINLSVKFSVLESFSEQCSRLLLKYSFQISHKLWLFIFLEIRKPSSSKREVIGVTYLQYQKGFFFNHALDLHFNFLVWIELVYWLNLSPPKRLVAKREAVKQVPSVGIPWLGRRS